jgi:pyruvate dehydrogenase E2 component (dihydrolipoamide acetyltransferase)
MERVMPDMIMAAATAVPVPDIGDIRNAKIIEILVRPGDRVAEGDALVLLETDKATLEVPAPDAGIVGDLLVTAGDLVQQGTMLLTLTQDEKAAPPPPSIRPPIPPASIAAVPPPPIQAIAPIPTGGPAYAGPAVRKLAREFGLDLADVAGSGEAGRIQAEDLHRHVRQAVARPPAPIPPASTLPPWPAIDFAKFGPTSRQPLSRIRRISGPALARNAATIPHVTNFDEADITDLEALRQHFNAQDPKAPRLTVLSFLIKAMVATLRRFPNFNAALDGDDLILKQYFHIGFAADTPNGLLVPVIRHADRKGLHDISAELADLALQAREGRIRQTDMEGGCISISSLGGIGGQGFTPIINAPEVAILGVARAATKPVWNGEAFMPRLMLPLSLSWDHRVLDGAEAARFLVHLTGLLGDIRQILL